MRRQTWVIALVLLLGAPQASKAGPITVTNTIVLTKTVGTTGDCATTDDITVPPGTQVTYCYQVQNVGTFTYTEHDLVDSELGQLLSNFPALLPPGGVLTKTASTNILMTTVNFATWTARTTEIITMTGTAEGSAQGASVSASSSDVATVTVEFLETEEEGGPDGCTDGIDNDGDGDIDCADSDCIGIGGCVSPAPVLGSFGLLLAGALLAGIGGLALARRRRG